MDICDICGGDKDVGKLAKRMGHRPDVAWGHAWQGRAMYLWGRGMKSLKENAKKAKRAKKKWPKWKRKYKLSHKSAS